MGGQTAAKAFFHYLPSPRPRTHLSTAFFELRTAPPRTGSPSATADCGWATVAPPVATFLASYDFAGKTIVPFMTHEGSRMGHSEADIRKLCPQGEPTKITSYCDMSPTRVFRSGRAPASISRLPWSTTAW
mgnify:FL=1